MAAQNVVIVPSGTKFSNTPNAPADPNANAAIAAGAVVFA
jgi:hypothetical protein